MEKRNFLFKKILLNRTKYTSLDFYIGIWGKKKTLEMLLSGDMIDAKEAERLGLVNKVVPAEKLEEETFAFAQKLIAKSPVAIEM